MFGSVHGVLKNLGAFGEASPQPQGKIFAFSWRIGLNWVGLGGTCPQRVRLRAS